MEHQLAAERAREATDTAGQRFTLDGRSTLAAVALSEWDIAYNLASERARMAELTVAALRDRIRDLEERVHFWKTEARSKRVRSRSPHK